MDGDIAPLKEIVALAKKHGAITFIDECHATGFLGATGRGTDEHCGVLGEIDIINSTLGKALGGGTGVCVCPVRGHRFVCWPCFFPLHVCPALAMHTLAIGGYTTGRKEIIDVLRQKARPYLFSNTIAPPVVGASLRVFEMLMASTEARDTLERNTKHFRERMTEVSAVCSCTSVHHSHVYVPGGV